MRARWKVLGLAYVKLGTSGHWIGTQIEAHSYAAADVHGAMGYDQKALH